MSPGLMHEAVEGGVRGNHGDRAWRERVEVDERRVMARYASDSSGRPVEARTGIGVGLPRTRYDFAGALAGDACAAGQFWVGKRIAEHGVSRGSARTIVCRARVQKDR